ncbi:ABC transporter permease [Neoaquamicrobium sediminum]|uniref:ABC transporter permease n=1 Tax=Neoaquamicrobium sediminum TaxID=1849104 RepID=UPI00156500D6|nr:ABC transporter permease [Mesorhizobium sediminum]NRC57334.1 ABC transporter permease [Mesorhizobium sediminum]
MRDMIIRTLSLLAFLATWWLLALVNASVQWVPAVMIPTPPQVLEAGWDIRELVPGDIAISLMRVFEGFLIAAVLGVLLGCLSGSSRFAENIIDPVLEVLRPIPPLAFLPIFIIWFGLGEASKVLMIAFSAFFIIYVNTYQGVRYADPLLMRAALSLGASKRQAFFGIGLPSAMPEIFTGLRLGIGMAFFVLVAAELIAADSGMGFRIQEARWQFRVDRMFFGAALIGMIGFILFAVLKFAESKLLAWKPRREAH